MPLERAFQINMKQFCTQFWAQIWVFEVCLIPNQPKLNRTETKNYDVIFHVKMRLLPSWCLWASDIIPTTD